MITEYLGNILKKMPHSKGTLCDKPRDLLDLVRDFGTKI